MFYILVTIKCISFHVKSQIMELYAIMPIPIPSITLFWVVPSLSNVSFHKCNVIYDNWVSFSYCNVIYNIVSFSNCNVIYDICIFQ